jgi:hypothetical protein
MVDREAGCGTHSRRIRQFTHDLPVRDDPPIADRLLSDLDLLEYLEVVLDVFD